MPWIIVDDFNELLRSHEKRGILGHPSYLSNQFQQVWLDLYLQDLGYVGTQFTWEKWRGTDRWVEEWLDRAVASRSWISWFGAAKIYHISHTSSDHIPIFLDLRKFVPKVQTKNFKFQNHWSYEEECGRLV
ncbi:uncharacterized protein LOC110625616 [Manihot esculenta]|uniref:Endonuclease/exonuclease/phosphatase domain-containing protein n=1 Tax=Manihot esculenta TaxID=3983 RepID=A0A2C9V0T6_MANES|nr:uncharacterized protein LOC110625616 [Manihot esculenta]